LRDDYPDKEKLDQSNYFFKKVIICRADKFQEVYERHYYKKQYDDLICQICGEREVVCVDEHQGIVNYKCGHRISNIHRIVAFRIRYPAKIRGKPAWESRSRIEKNGSVSEIHKVRDPSKTQVTHVVYGKHGKIIHGPHKK